MPDSSSVTTPNPSFMVLSIDPDRVRAVNNTIAAQLFQYDGTLSEPLGGDRHVFSRSAYKKLLLLYDNNPQRIREALRLIPGVRAVEFESAIAVGDAMMRRPAAAEPSSTSGETWNLDMVEARAAWVACGGLDECRWRNIRIGQIDTGYREHRAFGFGIAGRTPNILAAEGINYLGFGLPVDPPERKNGHPGHGTRIASIIGGHDPDHEFFGVAPGVSIVPYRITDSVVIEFLGNETRFAEALNHATQHSACDVVNVSLGDPCDPPEAMRAAIDAAYLAGVIVVAAAGNVTSELVYPGKFSRVIGCAGVTKGRRPWEGGSRGLKVDISAPADDIWRAELDIAGRHYAGEGSGTSYATAHVSASAALWLAFHGNALRNAYGERSWKWVEAFRTCLRSSATTPSGWPTGLYGRGILNVARLLQQPLPDTNTLVEKPPAAPERF